jgi:hypothetical protein
LQRKNIASFNRFIGENIEVIEIIGIGKRDKEEICKMVAKKLRKLKA